LHPVRVLGFTTGTSVLTVDVRGHGVVSGRGISCVKECAYERPQNTKVVLRAKPGTGRVLVRWHGACGGHSPRCTLVLRANAQVTAAFARRGQDVSDGRAAGEGPAMDLPERRPPYGSYAAITAAFGGLLATAG